jgi:serine protease DegQ
MRKLWLVFCQTATVCLAVLFVVTTLRPDLLNSNTPQGAVITTVKQMAGDSAAPRTA